VRQRTRDALVIAGFLVRPAVALFFCRLFLLRLVNHGESVVLGFGLEAVFLLGVGYTADTVTAITCLTLAVGFSGFAISGTAPFHSFSVIYTILLVEGCIKRSDCLSVCPAPSIYWKSESHKNFKFSE